MTEKTYSRVDEAEEIVKGLCEVYKDELWAVIPDSIVVLGIDNKKKGKKNKILAKIKPIKGIEKAILSLNNVKVGWAIEVYWSDWNQWTKRQKEWVIFHELLHVSADVGKSVKHDIEDFKILVDVGGVDWFNVNPSTELLGGEKVKFNLDLRPNLVDIDEPEEDDKDE